MREFYNICPIMDEIYRIHTKRNRSIKTGSAHTDAADYRK